MSVQIHHFSVCHTWKNPDFIVMHRHTLHHDLGKARQNTEPASAWELNGKGCRFCQWNTHILSYWAGQQLHSGDVFIKAFLVSLFPSLHWNNRQQFSGDSEVLTLPRSLPFPLNIFFPACRHPSIPWNNRICSRRVTVKIRLCFFPFFAEITGCYQWNNLWRGSGLQ